MKITPACFIAAALFGGTASAATMTPGAVAYSLGNNGTTLVTIANLAMPGTASGKALTDGAGSSVSLNAIDFRPRSREFFGYSNTTDTVYQVDVNTGVATPAVSTADGTDVGTLGFDFNNSIDAARIVSTAGDNLVFFPAGFPNGMSPNIGRFTDLFYAGGDANAGLDPEVFANAYTNAVPFPSSVTQFVLDDRTDSLAILANNAGTLTTVGKLAIDGVPLGFTATGEFDILSFADGDDTAYALLTTAGGQGLYQLALMAGMDGFVNATFLGSTSRDFGPLDGLTVAAVPLPPSIALLFAAMAGVILIGKR